VVRRYALSQPRPIRHATPWSLSVATTWGINKVQHTTFNYKGDDTSLIDRQNHQLLHHSFIALQHEKSIMVRSHSVCCNMVNQQNATSNRQLLQHQNKGDATSLINIRK
jgi:hypothetical protein